MVRRRMEKAVKNKTWKCHHDAIMNGRLDVTGKESRLSRKMSGVGYAEESGFCIERWDGKSITVIVVQPDPGFKAAWDRGSICCLPGGRGAYGSEWCCFVR